MKTKSVDPETRIRDLDRTLALGSETPLLGPALRDLRTAEDLAERLSWWEGAYRLYAYATARPEPGYDPVEHVLEWGDDLRGWVPPEDRRITPSPDSPVT